MSEENSWNNEGHQKEPEQNYTYQETATDYGKPLTQQPEDPSLAGQNNGEGNFHEAPGGYVGTVDMADDNPVSEGYDEKEGVRVCGGLEFNPPNQD